MIASQGWSSEIITVPYEFQKGADSMLKLKRMNS